MLFLNISSDKIQIADSNKELFLDRNGIENTLGPALIQRYRKHPWGQVFVLNGPGGFTNLRVGTLVLNLISRLTDYRLQIKDGKNKKSLNLLTSKPLNFYSISKPDLYKYLFKSGFLPSKGAIYIGQRHNFRIYDLTKMTYKQDVIENIGKYKDIFLDFVKEEYRPITSDSMISFQMTSKGLKIKYKKKEFAIDIPKLKLKPQFQIEPNYFIEAITS